MSAPASVIGRVIELMNANAAPDDGVTNRDTEDQTERFARDAKALLAAQSELLSE